MVGKLIWWSTPQKHGIISTTENGETKRYFLPLGRIVKGPDVLRPGMYVEFIPAEEPPADKPWLLQLVKGAIVSVDPVVQPEVQQ